MRKTTAFGLALALAGGAFALTMLKDPPQSVASHPGAASVKPAALQVPTGIPTGVAGPLPYPHEFEDGVLSARDAGTKVVQFPDPAGSISDGDCRVPAGQLTLQSDGTGVFKERIFSVGGTPTFQFRFHYYDQQWAPLISVPHDSVGEGLSELISFQIPEEMTVLEDEQPVRF